LRFFQVRERALNKTGFIEIAVLASVRLFSSPPPASLPTVPSPEEEEPRRWGQDNKNRGDAGTERDRGDGLIDFVRLIQRSPSSFKGSRKEFSKFSAWNGQIVPPEKVTYRLRLIIQGSRYLVYPWIGKVHEDGLRADDRPLPQY
jgi:hypothetical protein